MENYFLTKLKPHLTQMKYSLISLHKEVCFLLWRLLEILFAITLKSYTIFLRVWKTLYSKSNKTIFSPRTYVINISTLYDQAVTKIYIVYTPKNVFPKDDISVKKLTIIEMLYIFYLTVENMEYTKEKSCCVGFWELLYGLFPNVKKMMANLWDSLQAVMIWQRRQTLISSSFTLVRVFNN